MKKKVGRVEARIIMRNAKTFRDQQLMIPVHIPEPVNVPEPVQELPPTKKSFFTYLLDFIKKKGT